MSVRVQENDFDVGDEIKIFCASTKGDAGALVTFTGIVREGAEDSPISSMTLEHYPQMTQNELEKIEMEAHHRWPLIGSLIIHRYGELKPTDNIVLVITSSAHRQAAFEAAEFLVDWLKTKAPFWKLEITREGPSWGAAKNSDDQAAQRWNIKSNLKE